MLSVKECWAEKCSHVPEANAGPFDRRGALYRQPIRLHSDLSLVCASARLDYLDRSCGVLCDGHPGLSMVLPMAELKDAPSVVRDLNQPGIEHVRQCFAALLHDGVMVPLEEWARKQRQQIHPDWRGVYLPLKAHDGHGAIGAE